MVTKNKLSFRLMSCVTVFYCLWACAFNHSPNSLCQKTTIVLRQPSFHHVTLTRDSPRRLRLDASNSTSNSNSQLSFYWAWRYPDPRWNTSQAQDGIDSPYSSTAELILPAVGDYYILLTVHDGCAVSQLNMTLHAQCDSTPRTPNFANRSSVSTNGRNSVTLDLENTQTEKDGSNQFSCDFVTDWALYNFTENSPTGVNVVPQPPPGPLENQPVQNQQAGNFMESLGNMMKRWLS